MSRLSPKIRQGIFGLARMATDSMKKTAKNHEDQVKERTAELTTAITEAKRLNEHLRRNHWGRRSSSESITMN